MNYNLKVEMERINGNVVSNIEVSSAGLARRTRIVSADFDKALGDLKVKHGELLTQLETFHAPASAPAPETSPPAAKPKAKATEQGKSNRVQGSAVEGLHPPAKKAAKGKAKGK